MDPDVERIKNRVLSVITNRTDKFIEHRVKTLEDRLVELQGLFFTEMVQKGISVASAPPLGVYTESWSPLSRKYMRTKKKQMNSGCYHYSGRLKSGLSRSSAITAFGKPLVQVSSNRTGTNAIAYKTGKALKLKDISNKQNRYIIVSLYPKVKESLKKLQAEDYGKYIPGQRAFKLASYRGNETRPYLANYMNWWLDVKATSTIKRALK